MNKPVQGLISAVFIMLLLIHPFAAAGGLLEFKSSENTEPDVPANTRSSSEISSTRGSPESIDLNLSNAGLHPNSSIFGPSGAEAGYAIASGDINGDGIDDLVLGAPTALVNNSIKAGAVFVRYGSSQGLGFNRIENITESADIIINGSDENDRTGAALCIADVNGDGFGDIIIGAPDADGFNNSKESAGEVSIIYGNGGLSKYMELNRSLPGAHQNVTFYGDDSFDRFGSSISGAELVTGPGQFEDMIISAPEADGPDNARADTGEIYILKGNTTLPYEINMTMVDFLNNDTILAHIIYGNTSNQDLGKKMVAENINGDLRKELIINAYGLGPGGAGRTGCGELYVFEELDAWPRIIDLAVMEPNATIYGQSSGDYAGYSFDVANIDFDHHSDIVIGAPFANGPDSERIDAGEVYIIYGNSSLESDIDLDPELGQGPDVTIYGEGIQSNSDYLGYDVEAADFDNDGKPDILISAIFGERGDNNANSGTVYLISTYYPLPEKIDLRENRSVSVKIHGADADDRTGLKIISADLDSTAASEIVISTPYANGYLNNNQSSGEVHVIFGERASRPDIRGPVVTKTIPGNRSTFNKLDQDIVLEFDEPVVQDNFSFQCLPDPGGWLASWNATSEQVILSHNDFQEAYLYKFNLINANDSLGNPFNKEYWYGLDFFTGDFTPPAITSSSPGAGVTGVSPYANITINFTEEIKTATLVYNINPDPGGWLTPEWDPTLTGVELKHSNPFTEEQEYEIEITSARDTFDNVLNASDKPLKWKFTTGKKDPVLPWIEAVYPSDKKTGVATSSYIEIRFSEPMNLSKTVNAVQLTPAIDFEKTNWLTSINTLRFWPEWNFLPSTTYTVTVTASATDVNGNNLDGNKNQVFDGSPGDDYKWTFTTGSGGDITPPTVVAVRPGPDADNVILNHIIEIEFSEFMNTTSFENAFELSPIINGSFHGFYYYISFIPDREYEPNRTYTVRIKGNAKDRAGNGLDADSDGTAGGKTADIYSWKFTTASAGVTDTTPPTVIRTLPEKDAVDVPINTRLEIEFSEDMSWALAGDSLGVTPSVMGTFIWSGRTLIFDPYSDLELNNKYSIRVSAFARDLGGRFLDGDGDGTMEGSPNDDYRFTFTTGVVTDTNPPKVISTHPENNEIGVPRNTGIEIQFSEPMMESTAESAFSISPATDGTYIWSANIMIFTPDAVLSSMTKYTVKIGYFARDTAGNYLDGDGDNNAAQSTVDDYSFSFVTSSEYDTTPPTILSTIPKNGSSNIPHYTSIIINFSEPLNKIYFNDAFYIIPDVHGTISWFGTTMEFVPSGKLKPLTVYTIGVSYIAEDLSGNSLDGNGNGIADDNPEDNYVFAFKTANVTIIQTYPILMDIQPANSELDVSLSRPIELTFNKPMNTLAELFLFGCLPDPGGWERSWNADRTKVLLTHNKFDKSTDYIFTLFFAVDEDGFYVSNTPIIIEFRTASTDTSGSGEDGTYTIAGRDISYDTLMTILLVIFIWVVVIVIIAGWTLIRMRYDTKEGEREIGGEEESGDEGEMEDEDIKIIDEDEELDELPPPPEDDVPVVPSEAEAETEDAEAENEELEE